MSFSSQQTNSRSLNGVIEITDGIITIENGSISGLQDLNLNGDLNVVGTITAKTIQITDPPLVDNDATNKLYVNTEDAKKLNLTGGTMTGDINMSSNTIINVVNPTNDQDVANKKYVDTEDAKKLNLSGGTLTGDLTISKTGTTQDSNKNFIVLKNSHSIFMNPYFLPGSYNGLVGSGDKAILFTNGSVDTGNLVIGPHCTSNQGIKILGSSGNVGIGIIPTSKLDVNGGAVIRGQLNMNTNNKIINVANGVDAKDAVNMEQLDLKADLTYVNYQDALKADLTYVNTQDALKANTTYVDTQDALKLNKAGDFMTGTLILRGGTVPENTDVATANREKTYIKFSENGTTTDWAYLRQIGGYDDITIALDFHNEGTDGTFQLRSINSIPSPDDPPNTFFSASPTGFLMNAGLDMSNHKIINVADGVNNLDAVNKQQLDLKADKSYVDSNFVDLTTNEAIAGIKTFSNQVVFSSGQSGLTADSIPTTTTRQYITNTNQTITGGKTFSNSCSFGGLTFTVGATTSINFNTSVVNLNNGANCNNKQITNLATPTLPADATNKDYVDTQDAKKLNLTGGTLTGNLSITGGSYYLNGGDITSIGCNQTWYDLTSSRAKETYYSNGTGRPIQVSASFDGNNNNNTSRFALEVKNIDTNATVYINVAFTSFDSNQFTVSGIIPPGMEYRVTKYSGLNTGWVLVYWSELK